MPFGDCTGPWWANDQGYGRGFGRKNGFGRGFGGFGRGFCRGLGFFNWFNSNNNNDLRRVWLENKKRVLEAELEAINRELQQ